MKFRLLIALSLLTAALSAQSGALTDMLRDGAVEFVYSFSSDARTPVVGSGKVIFDRGRFKLSGNGLDIYCDSQTIWTVDAKAMEVYVESASAASHFLANPEKFLENVSGFRMKGESATGRYVNPSDSSVFDFKLDGIHRPAEVPEDWTFKTDNLDKKWIVTDLR